MASKKTFDTTNRTFQLVFSAVMVALGTVLSVIPVMQLPFGGSVTLFSQVPILAVSWILGIPWGLASGLAYAVLQILVGGIGNFSYVQGILAYIILVFSDYLVPFSFLGFGSILSGSSKTRSRRPRPAPFWSVSSATSVTSSAAPPSGPNMPRTPPSARSSPIPPATTPLTWCRRPSSPSSASVLSSPSGTVSSRRKVPGKRP